MLNKRIATQIRVYRKYKKMILENFSRKADTYLGRVERGEINITLSTLEKIIDSLGMTSFLDLESDDPTLSKLMREVKKSSKKLLIYLNDSFYKTTLIGSLFLLSLSSSNRL